MAKETLCWNCAKGADECCFMKRLEPVPNWKAKKVLYDEYCGMSHTYIVTKCPNFKPMRATQRETGKPYKTRAGVKVRCIETGRVYPSLKQCAMELHISDSYMSQCLSGRRKFNGLHFERV